MNSWWHGWGIRKVLRYWMYNNAGRDAVKSSLRSGKVFRIGTDQPTDLLDAIDRSDLGVLSSGVRDCDGSDRASRGARTARLKELAGL